MRYILNEIWWGAKEGFLAATAWMRCSNCKCK